MQTKAETKKKKNRADKTELEKTLLFPLLPGLQQSLARQEGCLCISCSGWVGFGDAQGSDHGPGSCSRVAQPLQEKVLCCCGEHGRVQPSQLKHRLCPTCC